MHVQVAEVATGVAAVTAAEEVAAADAVAECQAYACSYQLCWQHCFLHYPSVTMHRTLSNAILPRNAHSVSGYATYAWDACMQDEATYSADQTRDHLEPVYKKVKEQAPEGDRQQIVRVLCFLCRAFVLRAFVPVPECQQIVRSVFVSSCFLPPAKYFSSV